MNRKSDLGNGKKTSTPLRKSNNLPDALGATTVIRRKSLLEHLDANISSDETKTALYRMTAVGAYEEPTEDFMRFKERLIDGINTTCYDEPATGALVLFPKHFLHVLEGSEETLNKYIAACGEEFEEKRPQSSSAEEKLKAKMKILSYQRVYSRTSERWTPVQRKGSGTCDTLTNVRGFRNRLFEFAKVSWILSTVVPIFTQPGDVSPPQDPAEFSDPEDQVLVEEAGKNLLLDLDQEIGKYVPTVEAVEYFLKPKNRLPPLRSPKEQMEHCWDLPKLIFDSETVWPIPCRLAPYD